jgi:transcriptional regulator with XRE-family HTH domain
VAAAASKVGHVTAFEASCNYKPNIVDVLNVTGTGMKEDPNPAAPTADSRGVAYTVRLKRLRESVHKSQDEIAELLGISVREYDEWENYEGELGLVLSLEELSRLAKVLGVPTRLLFEDESQEHQPISFEQLGERVKLHLKQRAISLSEYEDRVGYEVLSALANPSEMMKWNVDCLRSVCAEVQVEWLRVLP